MSEKLSLLIGSAPYVEEWWKKYNAWFRERRYEIVVLNNAWKIVDGIVDLDARWFRSNDFFKIAQCQPTADQQKQFRIENSRTLRVPHWYNKVKGGTMICNVLCSLLNEAVAVKQKCRVVVIGSDLIYTGDKTHFYGNGGDDPLRFGKKYLRKTLQQIQKEYMEEGGELLNASTGETRLPFDRFTEHLS